MLNLDYITIADASDFLNISKQTMIRKESSLFSTGMKRNSNGWRFCDIYQLCEAYKIYWGDYPSWDKVASFLYDKGITSPDKVSEVLLKLKSNNKIS
jgi:hypothetical protein